MTDLSSLFAALASLTAVAWWAQAAPTRALGDGVRPIPTHRWASVMALLALQMVLACGLLGLAGGLFLVACAWMAAGLLFVLALNTWPQTTVRWCARAGWCSLLAGYLGLLGLF
jgi:hypothetical protein